MVNEQRRMIQNSFPTDPNERLNAVLSAINTEPKSVLIAKCLDPNEFRNRTELGLQYRNWADWPRDTSTFEGYCHKTLVPVGLVAEEDVTILNTATGLRTNRAWRLTPEGRKYGSPIAASALNFGYQHDLSLYSVFGNTASPGDSRSPGNTAKIVKLMDSGKNILADLAKNTNVDHPYIRGHLLRLKGAGLVNYDSVGSEENDWAAYVWIEGKRPAGAPAYHRLPTLTRKIAEELAKQGHANCNELARILFCDPRTVSGVLAHLAKSGFTRPKQFSGDKRSDASLTDRGKAVARFVYETEEALADGQALYRMEQKLYNLDQRITSHAAELYHAVSPQMRAKSSAYWTSRILEVIDSVERKGARPRDIKQVLGYNFGNKYLPELLNSGTLVKQKNGKEVRYRRP